MLNSSQMLNSWPEIEGFWCKGLSILSIHNKLFYFKTTYFVVIFSTALNIEPLHWCFFFVFHFTSGTSTNSPPHATEKNRLENRTDWVLIGTTCVVFIFICFTFVCVLFIKHRKGNVGYVRFNMNIFSFEFRNENYDF